MVSTEKGETHALYLGHAASTTRCELSSFFFLQGKVPMEIHVILTETLGDHALSYAVKNWVAQSQRGDFSTCDAPHPARPKTVTSDY
jgi:hypothetical protein